MSLQPLSNSRLRDMEAQRDAARLLLDEATARIDRLEATLRRAQKLALASEGLHFAVEGENGYHPGHPYASVLAPVADLLYGATDDAHDQGVLDEINVALGDAA